MRPSDSDAARRLLEIADRVARLPAYNARNPHAFHEGKSELAADLRTLATEFRSPATVARRRIRAFR